MAAVILVDDDPVTRQLLNQVLLSRGHQILEAADGAVALQLARRHRPDLVISDILMPAMDGYELARQLRADPVLANTRLIFFTGKYDDPQARKLAREAGVLLYLSKPRSPAAILAAVDSALAQGLPMTAPQIPSADFEREHLRLLTDRLAIEVQNLRLQIDRLPLAYILVGPDFCVRDWNPAAERTFGYAREEALGRSCLELIIPLPVSDHLQEVFRRVWSGDMDAHSVNENRNKEGRIITCQWFNTPVHAADGCVTSIISLAQDITERKRAEEDRARLAAIVASSEDAIIGKNLDGTIISWNAGAERLYGYTAAEIIGRSMSLLFPADASEKLPEIMQRIQDGKPVQHYDTERLRKDSQRIEVSVSISPVRDAAGKIIGASAIARDNSERKRTEKMLKENAAQLQTLTRRLVEVQEEERRHISRELHDEFGQILTAVNLNLHAVQDQVSAEVWERLAENIALVDRALQQARDLSLNLRPAMLDMLGLEPTLEWFADRQALRAGFAVQFRSRLGTKRLPERLEIFCFRVVQEALTNVTRHAHAQHVEIELEEKGGTLQLVVQDDGLGFDVAAALERARRGESFGLLGMQERVQLLDGELTIHSEPGRGARLVALLPL